MTVNSPQPDSPANVKRLTSAEMMARSEEMLNLAYLSVKAHPSPEVIRDAALVGQGYALLALARLKYLHGEPDFDRL